MIELEYDELCVSLEARLEYMASQATALKKTVKELTIGETRLINCIARNTKEDAVVPLAQVTRSISIAPSALSQMLKSLEKRGFVERIPDKDDRRAVNLKLTPEGLEQHRKLLKANLDRTVALIEIIGREKAEDFNDVLKVIIDHLDALIMEDKPRSRYGF